MKPKEFLFVLYTCCILSLYACNYIKDNDHSSIDESMHLIGIPISDSMDLCSLLMESFSLRDLMDFYWQDPGKYWDNNDNMSVTDCMPESEISIVEAEKRFPMVAIRTSGYTVYKVTEGGRFYVFFVDKDHQMVSSTSDPDRVVASTCYYIPKQNLFSRHFMIKKGDTISRVRQIDPLITVDHISETRRSFVYLNANKVMVLYLQNNGTVEDEYVIIEKRVINRKESMSRLAIILDEDLEW